jgi:hypothetical protein
MKENESLEALSVQEIDYTKKDLQGNKIVICPACGKNGKEIYRNLEVRYGLRVNKFKLYKTAKVRGTKNSFVALLSFDEKTHTYQTRMGSVYGTYHVTELKSYCL